MSHSIEVVTERLKLGEGPHWDAKQKCLYFVDIMGKTINKLDPKTGVHTKANIELGRVGFLVPVDGTKDKFLLGVERKLIIVQWDGVSSSVSNVEEVLEVDNEPALINNRWNDAKADPAGRLWGGTMGPEPEIGKLEMYKGTLFSFNGKVLKRHVERISIANGLAWNTKIKKMYYIDSPKRTVDQYDYDIVKGEIKNCKAIFNLDDHNIPGVPDGMTIDTDGNLWVCVFNGSCICHVNPNTGELIRKIDFPAAQITACAFGGNNMDELYVTSAQLVIDGKIAPAPAGALFKVTNLGAKGEPGYTFKKDAK